MNPYLRAIEIIKERGWWQGDLYGPNEERCLLGAVPISADADFSRRLAAAVGEVAPFPPARHCVNLIVAWNDAPERTIEDVYLALKYAAADWDAEHDREVSA